MTTKEDLIALLRRREQVIADHAWRDRDPSSHLDALRDVSEQLSAWPTDYGGTLEPKLKHYLSNASYAKALAHLEHVT